MWLEFLPALALIFRESTFVLIALGQAAVVFFLCLASKNRAAALGIGGAAVVAVSVIGSSRYTALDVLCVLAATLAAVWKLTPSGAGETGAELRAFAGKAAGVVLATFASAAAGLWYYANHGRAIEAAAPSITPSMPAPSLRSMNNEAAQPVFALPASPTEKPLPKGTSADLRTGMTEAEVLAIMGHPDNVTSLVSSGGVRVDAWEYRGANGVFHIYMKNGRKSL